MEADPQVTEISVKTRNLRGGVRKNVISTHGLHSMSVDVICRLGKDDAHKSRSIKFSHFACMKDSCQVHPRLMPLASK